MVILTLGINMRGPAEILLDIVLLYHLIVNCIVLINRCQRELRGTGYVSLIAGLVMFLSVLFPLLAWGQQFQRHSLLERFTDSGRGSCLG